MAHSRSLTLLIIGAALLAGACGTGEDRDQDYAARVGDRLLTEAEIDAMFSAAPAGLDSTAARQHLINQWVTNELLAYEARRRGLLDRSDVRRQIEESERAILAATLVESVVDEAAGEPTEEDMQEFFEMNRERLVLRESYVRIRHVRVATAARAESARAALARVRASAEPDSVWAREARQLSDDAAGSLALSQTHIPESSLRMRDEALAAAVRTLRPGEISPVIESGGVYHVVQLVGRVPAGTPAELDWVRDELRQQVALRTRQQLIAQQVQRLKAEAQANDILDIP
ncbi:hypothetical protein BH23BAC4_BH23BAC4_04700 [soil metagenome]